MSKPTYEDLVALLARIYKTTKVESVLDIEWANYPVEVFNEVIDMVVELELDNE